MTKRGWKEHLLSSGVPLEYSVMHILHELTDLQPDEFKYTRKDEGGLPKVFSIDVHSYKIDSAHNYWLESLVECKYRHDGTKWVFTPRDYDPVFGQDFSDLFITLDQCCEDRKINRDLISSFSSKYPLGGKGIELLPDDANHKTIEQAVQQLRYAVVNKAIDGLVHQIDKLLGTPNPIFVIVPIIVTTAELWLLKRGTTVESVRQATEIQDVAQSLDLIVYMREPDIHDKNHSIELFNSNLNGSQIKSFEDMLLKNSKIDYDLFVNQFASNKPSLFVIIRYQRFKSSITKLHKYFSQPSIIAGR